MRQGFAKHFQNLNLKPSRVEKHGYNEPKELYHERVKIPNKLNKTKMKAYTPTNVVLVSTTPAPNITTMLELLIHELPI